MMCEESYLGIAHDLEMAKRRIRYLEGIIEKTVEVLSRQIDGKYGNTSGEVLPDLDGQNLTD